MVINTDRSYLRAFLFFASAPLVGLVIIVAGYPGGLFKATLGAIAILLAPFLFIGIAAGVASLRGTTIGWCTWLGGFASVLVLFFVGVLDYWQGIRHGAWTGASLSLAMTACAALPASVVGSLIGLGIGFAISKRQDKPSVDRKADMEDIADESGVAP
ncbi:MAG: hypothetical protein ACHRXM_25400 [Isosphaerales bacterium]